MNNSLNSALSGMSSQFNSYDRLTSHLSDGPSLEDRIESMELQLASMKSAKLRRDMDTPKIGPTQRELDTYPALKSSWEAYEITKKLIGIK